MLYMTTFHEKHPTPRELEHEHKDKGKVLDHMEMGAEMRSMWAEDHKHKQVTFLVKGHRFETGGRQMTRTMAVRFKEEELTHARLPPTMMMAFQLKTAHDQHRHSDSDSCRVWQELFIVQHEETGEGWQGMKLAGPAPTTTEHNPERWSLLSDRQRSIGVWRRHGSFQGHIATMIDGKEEESEDRTANHSTVTQTQERRQTEKFPFLRKIQELQSPMTYEVRWRAK